MPQSDPEREARTRVSGSTPLGEIASDPIFKEGYADGRARKPIASYSRLYLEGYQEGALRAPTGLIDRVPLTER